MYHRLADYVSDNKTHVMTYEDFVRDEDGGLEGLMAQLYPDRPGGRVEILATRKPSDIVKRSNSQVKKMVAPRADVKPPRSSAVGANRSFRAGDERGRGRGLVRRVGRAGAVVAHVPRRRHPFVRPSRRHGATSVRPLPRHLRAEDGPVDVSEIGAFYDGC